MFYFYFCRVLYQIFHGQLNKFVVVLRISVVGVSLFMDMNPYQLIQKITPVLRLYLIKNQKIASYIAKDHKGAHLQVQGVPINKDHPSAHHF